MPNEPEVKELKIYVGQYSFRFKIRDCGGNVKREFF